MPKSPQNDLYKLICSLSTNERKQIRRHFGRDRSENPSNSEVLFDALLEITAYDESQLKQALPPNIARNLAYEKNKLRGLLVVALRRYLTSKRPHMEVRNCLSEVEILHERGLYKQCRKLLQTARQLAEQYALTFQLLEVNQWDRALAKRYLSKSDEQLLDRLIEEGEEISRKITQQLKYRALADKVFRVSRKESVNRKPSNKKVFQDLLADELLQQEPVSGTFESRKLFFVTRATLFSIIGDTQAYQENYRLAIELWQQFPRLQSLNRRDYKINLTNYLQACHHNRDFAPFPEILAELKALPAQSEDEKLEDWHGITGTEFLGSLAQGHLKQAAELAPVLEEGLGKYRDQIPQSRYLTTYYNLAVFYFVTDQPKQALQSVAPILDIQRCAQRADICHFCKVFEILLYFEMGNQRLLHRFFQIAYNQLQRAGRLFKFERAVLRSLKSMDPQGHPLNHARFQQLLTQLESLKAIPTEVKARGFDEVLLYVRSKVERCSMGELLLRHSS